MVPAPGLPARAVLAVCATTSSSSTSSSSCAGRSCDGLDGEDLNYPYLLFESNFDGPWQHYIDAFAYVIPTDIRVTWGRGPGFPAPPPAEPLKAWIAANSMEGGTYYCAHAEHSTRDWSRTRSPCATRFDDFRARAASLGPDEFKAAWERFLTDAQSAAVSGTATARRTR